MDVAPSRKTAVAVPSASRSRLRRWLGRQVTVDPDDFSDRRANLGFLLLYSALVTLPLLFAANPDGQSVSLGGHSLPPACFSQALCGVSCPGCGLTRSFIETAHGHFSAALARHRLGIALYALFLGQALLRLWCLRRAPRPMPHRVIVAHHWVALAMIALLIGNWLVGLALGGNGL